MKIKTSFLFTFNKNAKFILIEAITKMDKQAAVLLGNFQIKPKF